MKPIVHLVRVRCRCENRLIVQVEHKPSFWPFSHAKPRTGSHRSYQRNLTTERPFSLAAGCSLKGAARELKTSASVSSNVDMLMPQRLSVNSTLNPDTGSGHSRLETCGAAIRGVLRLGHARTSQLTGQQEQENVRALHGVPSGLPEMTGCKRSCRNANALSLRAAHHSEPCGFSFLSSFRSGCWKRIAGPGVCSVVSLGGFLSFPVFLDSFCFAFVLTCACAALVQYKYSTGSSTVQPYQYQSIVVNTGTAL